MKDVSIISYTRNSDFPTKYHTPFIYKVKAKYYTGL